MNHDQEVILSTLDQISGREIKEFIGIAIGVGNVAFGPLTANKARGAISKAMRDLGRQLNEMDADALLGLQIEATSSGIPFFRPHTAIITGTAVKLK
jgi:uncharacterized protein YbjQ (UPF0145 family)